MPHPVFVDMYLVRCHTVKDNQHSSSQPSFDCSASCLLHRAIEEGRPSQRGRDGLARLFRIGRSIVDQPPVATPTTTVAIETTMPPTSPIPCRDHECWRKEGYPS